jgi:hypothetical protein
MKVTVEELGVVDQHVGALTQFANSSSAEFTVKGLLMITQVRNYTSTPFDSKSECGAYVRNEPRHDRGRSNEELVIPVISKNERRREFIDRHREHRRLDGRTQGLCDARALTLSGAVNRDSRPSPKGRCVKREALNVIPVEMANQTIHFAGVVMASAGISQPGAEIEHQRRVARDIDLHTGGVPAIAAYLLSMARGRTAHTVEGQMHTFRLDAGRLVAVFQDPTLNESGHRSHHRGSTTTPSMI